MTTPVARVDTTNQGNQNNIPFAERVFDTNKLYRRWRECCRISLIILNIGLEHADNMQIEAGILGTLGFIFNSNSMKKSAEDTNNKAHDFRVFTIICASSFLVTSVILTAIYWGIEEGVVGLIAKFCYQSVVSAADWIKSKTTNIFNNNLDHLDIPYGQQVSENPSYIIGPSPAATVCTPPDTSLLYGYNNSVAKDSISAPIATVCAPPDITARPTKLFVSS